MDLMKAYDSVRQDFLLAVLRTIGFLFFMVNWIGECVSTTRFSVSINEQLHDFFVGCRRLRQVDANLVITWSRKDTNSRKAK
jgi:hypothetical protein